MNHKLLICRLAVLRALGRVEGVLRISPAFADFLPDDQEPADALLQSAEAFVVAQELRALGNQLSFLALQYEEIAASAHPARPAPRRKQKHRGKSRR